MQFSQRWTAFADVLGGCIFHSSLKTSGPNLWHHLRTPDPEKMTKLWVCQHERSDRKQSFRRESTCHSVGGLERCFNPLVWGTFHFQKKKLECWCAQIGLSFSTELSWLLLGSTCSRWSWKCLEIHHYCHQTLGFSIWVELTLLL